MKKTVKPILITILTLLLAGSNVPYAYAETNEVKEGEGYVSVNNSFTTESGTRQVLMCGLKGDVVTDTLNTIQTYWEQSIEKGVFLRMTNTAFCDAEKYDESDDGYGSTDGSCWEASIANMLWISGWKAYLDPGAPDFGSEDDIYDLYDSNFTSRGSDVYYGIDWFFTGEYFVPGSGSYASLIQSKPEHGYLKSFYSLPAQTDHDLIKNPADIAALAKLAPENAGTGQGQSVFQASIGELYNDTFDASGHSVTVVGIIIDPNETDQIKKYKAIILSDSDNDADPTPEEKAEVAAADEQERWNVRWRIAANRPNSYTVYPLEYHTDAAGVNGWLIGNYGENEGDLWGIYSLDELPLPSQELIDKNRETEGSMDHINDPDFRFNTLFISSQENNITDPNSKEIDEISKGDYLQGEPIILNYFVMNRSSKTIEAYEEGKELLMTWYVTRDSDGEVVAEGTHVSNLPIRAQLEGGTEEANLVYLNAVDGKVQRWEPGDYTFHADLNKDHRLKESYFINNTPVSMKFTVQPSEEPVTEYTITFDLDGGTLNGETGIVDYTYAEDTVIIMPLPEKSGYEFDHWEGSSYKAGEEYTVVGDHTFKAVWKKIPAPDDKGSTPAPDTGDHTNTGIWWMMFGTSVLVVLALAAVRRRA